MRLAHYSDIHVTLSPREARVGQLLGKRLAGMASYYVGGRRIHFARVEHRVARLLEDIDAQQVDHALCTGDVTQMSFREEFARCARLFGDRVRDPRRHTVIPGNHDRYTRRATEERRFEAVFGDVAPPSYPYLKPVGGGVSLVLVDVTRPVALFDSSGLCGEEQRANLAELLGDPALADQFVIVALHYALLRPGGEPDRRAHRIRDYRSLLEVLDDPRMHADLILHGHIHASYTVETERRTIICTGSATDLHGPCGYNLYDIDPVRKTFTQVRRAWSILDDRFV